jgi:trimeric autotransporter adhesin
VGRHIARVDAEVVADAARAFLLAHAELLGIDASQLGPLRTTQVTDTLWQVSAPQMVNGIRVRDARLALTISHGNALTFGTESWGTVTVRTEPTIDAEQVLKAGFEHAGGRAPNDVVVQEPRLEIVVAAPLGDRADEAYAGRPGQGYVHRLVWSLAFQRPPDNARWEALVDAESGTVLAFQDTNHYVNKQITGAVYPLTNTGVCPTPQTCGTAQPGWPMPFSDTGLPAPNHVTNSAGVYDYTGLAPTTTLTGPFVDVFDNCGALSATSATGDIDLGGTNGQHDCTIGNGGGPGNTSASRSAFYEVNKLAEQARGWLPSNVWLQSRLGANLNIPQTCNAFWNGSTINFYRSGGGCGNTGEIAAIFDHEWGHGLDDNDANGVISNSGEGYADIAAILRLQTSCVGHGFSIGATPGACGLTADGTGPNRNENQLGGLHCDLDCSGVRDADWDKHADHAPDTALGFVCTQCGTGTGPCGRQVHCAAAPARQAAWDLVTRDLVAPPFGLDSQSAFLLGNRIFYQGSGNIGAWHACTCGASSSGCGATNGYIQWLAADDDNGSLNDGTPHMTALFAAFDRHGIACSVPAPVNSGCAETPAAPVLSATAGAYSATLDWSAVPGASEYWVLRSEGHAGCDFGKARIAEFTGTTFTDTQVAPGRSYAYNVVAQGASPACSSPVSNCVQVTPTVSTDPDFSVTCNPSSLAILQGNSATSTCTIASANGFSSEVSLACAGLPADATCDFVPAVVTPNPNGSTTSTLTVSVAATTPAGLSAVQVSGTSGALTHAANVSLTVLAPNFTVACLPSSLSVVQGSSVTSTCTIASQNGFDAEVALSCGALPAGTACGFSPAVVTPPANGTVASTLTVSTSQTTPGGATGFQVLGTSATLQRSANLTLTVLVPAFTVACNPSIVSAVQGSSTATTCTVASQNGFSAPVDLTCANLPAGATCGFSATPVTPPPNGTVTSTLTLGTSTATPGGLLSFQVVGTSGALTRTANLMVNVLLPSFALSCTPASLSVPQGNSVISTCRVTSANTFSAPVSLSCGTLPAGASCVFSPAEVTPPPNGFVNSTLTVSTSAATPLATTAFQAIGTGGGLTRIASLSLTVTAPPDFAVTCTPASLSSSPGGSASSICRVTSLRGFNSAVGLACSGLPPGVACSLSPAVVTPPPNGQAGSALLVTTDPSVPTGLYPFSVTGNSGALTRSAALTLRLTRTIYFDDFESATGWVTNPDGTDTATRGRWERGVPEQYTGGGIIIQNGTTPSPVNDLVTGASTVGSNGDIDGGSTSVQSPPIVLPSGILTLSFSYYLAHRNDSSADDFFRASVVTSSGATVLFQELGTATNDAASFTLRSVDLSPFAGQTVRIRFAAGDFAVDNLLEAAVDDVRIVVQ